LRRRARRGHRAHLAPLRRRADSHPRVRRRLRPGPRRLARAAVEAFCRSIFGAPCRPSQPVGTRASRSRAVRRPDSRAVPTLRCALPGDTRVAPEQPSGANDRADSGEQKRSVSDATLTSARRDTEPRRRIEPG